MSIYKEEDQDMFLINPINPKEISYYLQSRKLRYMKIK